MTKQHGGHETEPAILERAPLARVLVQIKWPELTDFSLDLAVASLSRTLGSAYPLKRRDSELQFILTPLGPQQQANGFVHRFASATEEWVVSVGEGFLSIETSAYRGHEEMASKLTEALAALKEAATIPVVTRVGYRYTNRITGEDDLQHLGEWFSPSILGGVGDAPAGSELVHSITESVFRVGDSALLVRSAQVGPNESIDPTLAPVAHRSWVLDLDAFDETRRSFDPPSVTERAMLLSKIASKQFSALTTEKLVERFS